MPKLPSLDSILLKDEKQQERKKQTPEDMIAVCKLLNAALGGEIIET